MAGNYPPPSTDTDTDGIIVNYRQSSIVTHTITHYHYLPLPPLSPSLAAALVTHHLDLPISTPHSIEEYSVLDTARSRSIHTLDTSYEFEMRRTTETSTRTMIGGPTSSSSSPPIIVAISISTGRTILVVLLLAGLASWMSSMPTTTAHAFRPQLLFHTTDYYQNHHHRRQLQLTTTLWATLPSPHRRGYCRHFPSSSSPIATTKATSTTKITSHMATRTNHNLRPLFAKNNIKQQYNTNDEPAVEITFPTPTEAIELGIRDWPQQFHSSSWTESIIEGGIATRYILDGNGRLSITYYNNNDPGGPCQSMNNVRVYPGTLIEVNGEAVLQWTVDDAKVGMIVLTPTYEEGGKLVLVGAALMVFCAGLIIGSTTGGL